MKDDERENDERSDGGVTDDGLTDDALTDDALDGLLAGLVVRGPVPAAPSLDGAARLGDEEHEAEPDAEAEPTLDALIGGLRARGPVPPAPALPRARRPLPVWWGAAALAAVALVAVGVAQWSPGPRVTARGETAAAVELQLELSVDRGQGAERVGPGDTVSVGDTLYLRLGSTPAARVVLWVEDGGPAQVIHEQEASPEPALVATEHGLLGYRPDAPGRLVVGARAGAAEVTVALQVAP